MVFFSSVAYISSIGREPIRVVYTQVFSEQLDNVKQIHSDILEAARYTDKGPLFKMPTSMHSRGPPVNRLKAANYR